MKVKTLFKRRSIDFEAYLPETHLHLVFLEFLYYVLSILLVRGRWCLVTGSGPVRN
jgi:hypothetical protein